MSQGVKQFPNPKRKPEYRIISLIFKNGETRNTHRCIINITGKEYTTLKSTFEKMKEQLPFDDFFISKIKFDTKEESKKFLNEVENF